MTKRNQKATVWQGTTENIECHLTKNGAPLVLTGATIEYTLTNTTTDELILLYDNGVLVGEDITTGYVAIIDDGTAPGCRFSIVTVVYDPDDTEDLTPGDNYRHELRVTLVDKDTEVYMSGPVTIVESDTLKTLPEP